MKRLKINMLDCLKFSLTFSDMEEEIEKSDS